MSLNIFLLFAIIALVVPGSACAQHPNAALASSQRYGWYHTIAWAEERTLGRPGWKRQSSGTSSDGWDYVLFMANDAESAVAYRTLQGTIGNVIYSFVARNPEGRMWRTNEFEQVGENEWIDRPNNARIHRKYNGDLIEYDCDYEPFTKE